MRNVNYKLTLECIECGREIEKFTKHRHSSVLMGQCQDCEAWDVQFTVTDSEKVDPDQVPGLGVA